MSRFLLLSGSGEGLGIGLLLKTQGHEVLAWIRDGGAKRNYEGLLHCTSHWEDHLSPGTTVLFDSVGGGKTADRLRNEGNRVIGGGLFSDQLDFDWEVTSALLSDCDIAITKEAVPPLYNVEGWFTGKIFRRPVLYSMRKTRLCNDDLGPRTPGMGTVCWVGSQSHSYLESLVPMLVHYNYIGPVSLTLDSRQRVVDWVCRFTFDQLPCLTKLWTENNLAPLFNSDKDLNVKPDLFASAIRVVQPGYGSLKKVPALIPIDNLDKAYYLFDVFRGSTNLITSGYRGVIGSVLSYGPTIWEAFASGYERAFKLQCPDKLFRTDLGAGLCSFQSDYNKLFGGSSERITFPS